MWEQRNYSVTKIWNYIFQNGIDKNYKNWYLHKEEIRNSSEWPYASPMQKIKCDDDAFVNTVEKVDEVQ